jgi:hypothetical protein
LNVGPFDNGRRIVTDAGHKAATADRPPIIVGCPWRFDGAFVLGNRFGFLDLLADAAAQAKGRSNAIRRTMPVRKAGFAATRAFSLL